MSFTIGTVPTFCASKTPGKKAGRGATSEMEVSLIHWVPLILTSIIAVFFISVFLFLAWCLSARRWRRAALVLAGISCIGIAIGTILGGLTLYALTRPEVAAAFTPTI